MRLGPLFVNGVALEDAGEVGLVEREPGEVGALLGLRERTDDLLHRPALLANLDLVARAHDVARDVHPLAVHEDVIVLHDLARLRAREGEAEAVDDVVEPALEEAEHLLARTPLATAGVEVVV